MSIVSAILPGSGDINEKTSILWELIFRRDLKQKLAPPRQQRTQGIFLLTER